MAKKLKNKMPKKTKILIENFRSKPIFFDTRTSEFVYSYLGDEYRDKDINILKRQIRDASISAFTGTFYLKEYDGIDKFKAKRKFINEFSGQTYISGIQIDGKYGNESEERVKLAELYPINAHNKKIFKKFRKLVDEGWALIYKGENLKNELKK